MNTNSKLSTKLIVSLVMILSSFLAFKLKPSYFPIQNFESNLEEIIPVKFVDWSLDASANIQIVNPEQKENIDRIYADTINRTYINSKGQRIMLSVAYGSKQSYVNQVHKPEVCYSAQGFQIIKNSSNTIKLTNGRTIKSTRLVASQGNRIEPIIYTIRVGKFFTKGSTEQNLVRVKYGLKGVIPDGLLFRTSEINSDIEDSFKLQERFMNDLLSAASANTRDFLLGDSFPL